MLWEPHETPSPRPADEVIERVAVLNVIVNCAYGMPADLATSWLDANGLNDCLTDREQQVVDGRLGHVEEDRSQVEAIDALAWYLVMRRSGVRFSSWAPVGAGFSVTSDPAQGALWPGHHPPEVGLRSKNTE